MGKTTTCQTCKKYDKTADVCTLEPFEGQYTTGCPEIDMTVGGKIGIAIIFLVITGVLWILHPILGTIALILTVLILATRIKIVATMTKVAVVVAVAILIGAFIFAGDVPESDMQSAVIETPVVKETPAEQPTVIETPEPVAIQPTVAQPAEVPVEKSPQVDPWKSREPETEYERLQAISAMVLVAYLETEFDEAGFVLMAKKSGSGYKTFVWAKNDNGLIVVIDPMDDSCQLVMNSDHDRKYSNWHIKYVSWSEYEKICANYPSA